MSANATTAAPTGRKKSAQGKERSDTALGHSSGITSSPDGAKEAGWRIVALQEVGRIVTGSTPPKARQDYYGGSFPFVKPGELLHCTVSESADHLTDAGSEVADVVPAGGVLVSCIGNLGKTGLATRPVAFNQQINAIIPHFQDHSKWVFYAVQTPDFASQISAVSSATTIAIVNKGKFSMLRIPLAPLPEQRRIVEEIEKQFTRLEAGVAALRRVQANLKRYRTAVLKAACEGRLVPTEAEWKTTILGEISTVLAGYGFPERLQGRATGDIGFFKVGDISGAWKRNEKTLTQANHYISKADLTELRAKLLPTGTVVFAKIGAAIALNRRAIIGEPSLVDNNVMGLLAGERIHPRYLFHFLCTQKLDELARATTVPSIRKGDVEGIELKLPPVAEQTRIVAEVERRLSVVQELDAVVTANLQRATGLRQAVLHDSFSEKLP